MGQWDPLRRQVQDSPGDLLDPWDPWDQGHRLGRKYLLVRLPPQAQWLQWGRSDRDNREDREEGKEDRKGGTQAAARSR